MIGSSGIYTGKRGAVYEVEGSNRNKSIISLKTPGIYSIPCECGKVYTGQSSWSIQHRIKEHKTFNQRNQQ
jgi:hypothetical protein